METIVCPYCQSKANLVSSKIVYHGQDFGLIYLCANYPKCDAYVGVHKGTDKPLGRLANPELREWKKKAHSMFNPLYQVSGMSRKDAYKFLQKIMNLSEDDAHIGKFDVGQCKSLVRKLQEMNFDNLREFEGQASFENKR